MAMPTPMRHSGHFRRRLTAAGLLAAALLASVAPTAPSPAQQAQPRPIVPDSFALAETARRAMEAEWLTEDERAAMRLFHGVWSESDVRSPGDRAMIALNQRDLANAVFDDERVPVEVRAEARLLAGRLREAIDMLAGVSSMKAVRIRAEALRDLGRHDDAFREVDAVLETLALRQVEDAAELTEGVRAMIIRAELAGQPARDFQTMMELLALAHQKLDRLYWPARLVEAELLIEKHNDREAMDVLHETLSLNPRCAEAWHLLGHVALSQYAFDSVAIAEDALRRLNPTHVLADLLRAESRLTQNDPALALELVQVVLDRWPEHRRASALLAACHAMLYDEAAMQAALDRYDELSPGSAKAYALAGHYLSIGRQYEWASEILTEAVRRQPAWPAPQIDLGLMEMQAGRDAVALDVLQAVVQLDPFNKRAANSLVLLEELADYERIESEHFIVKYKDGIDVILAELMPPVLEELHKTVSARLGFEPDQKTVIEVLPDHERFGVRITGMPWIHTIAACTGPVIAMEVPREGPKSKHFGPFDWPRVLQHEYTHTVTLEQTQNRIPHWLTEAVAVSLELRPREFETCVVLADSWRSGTLFTLDEINFAFVRPKKPGDRSKAYDQGHWMVEFMDERYGTSALLRLLRRYYEGEREADAILNALGVSREQFYDDFLEWAGEQVSAWGMDPQPPMQELLDDVRMADVEAATMMRASQQGRLDAIARRLTDEIGLVRRAGQRSLSASDWPELIRPSVRVTDEQLREWLDAYPDHPDLIRMDVERRIEARGGTGGGAIDEGVVPLLQKLLELRPVDPWPHRRLAQYWLASNEKDRAIEHLEALDARTKYDSVYAIELAKLYRERGETEKSLQRITRAVHINPYHAASRELAAAIAVEAGRLHAARTHVHALTLIEPDRPQHMKRLSAIDGMLKQQ